MYPSEKHQRWHTNELYNLQSHGEKTDQLHQAFLRTMTRRTDLRTQQGCPVRWASPGRTTRWGRWTSSVEGRSPWLPWHSYSPSRSDWSLNYMLLQTSVHHLSFTEMWPCPVLLVWRDRPGTWSNVQKGEHFYFWHHGHDPQTLLTFLKHNNLNSGRCWYDPRVSWWGSVHHNYIQVFKEKFAFLVFINQETKIKSTPI